MSVFQDLACASAEECEQIFKDLFNMPILSEDDVTETLAADPMEEGPVAGPSKRANKTRSKPMQKKLGLGAGKDKKIMIKILKESEREARIHENKTVQKILRRAGIRRSNKENVFPISEMDSDDQNQYFSAVQTIRRLTRHYAQVGSTLQLLEDQ
jgi:hypothetical protein